MRRTGGQVVDISRGGKRSEAILAGHSLMSHSHGKKNSSVEGAFKDNDSWSFGMSPGKLVLREINLAI